MNLDKRNFHGKLGMGWLGLGLLAMLLLTGCSGAGNSSNLPETITTAKAAYDETPSDVNRNALMAAVYKEAKQDGPNQVDILKTGVEYGKEINQPVFTSSCLHSLIRLQGSGEEGASNILDLIQIMDKDLKQVNASIALKRGFYGEYPDHPKSAEFKEKLPVYTQNIDTLLFYAAQRITADSSGQFDPKMAREYVNIAEGLVLAHPGYEKATDALFNAAKMAGTIRDFNKSMSLYDWIINDYAQDDAKRAQSIFMKAFTYDSSLKNIEKAKELYSQFVKEYPDHELADDAQFLVENLGLSDEEFLKKIQDREKTESK